MTPFCHMCLDEVVVLIFIPISGLCRYLPTPIFQILLQAVTGAEAMVSQLQLRKWVQMLVNRSLVLGSWERPQ